jgi:hypothetical protein
LGAAFCLSLVPVAAQARVHNPGCKRPLRLDRPTDETLLRYADDDWCRGSGLYYRNRTLDVFTSSRILRCPACEDDGLEVWGIILERLKKDTQELGQDWLEVDEYEKAYNARRLHQAGKLSREDTMAILDRIDRHLHPWRPQFVGQTHALST